MTPQGHLRWAFAHRTIGLGLLSMTTVLASPTLTRACDICAVYTATEQGESRIGPRAGLAVQYTHYGTLRENGDRVPNPEHQSLDSVITQVLLGYQVTPRIGLQLNLPLITRQFVRIQDGRRVRGNVSGPGDLSLLAHVLVHSIVTETSVFRFSVLGGLELPTGDPAYRGEELAEEHPHGADEHMPENGVHGHDLALGSGSVDGLVGGELFWSWQRAFVSGSLHYAIRGDGAFDYRYANELTWTGGPGAYLLLDHDHSLALQALVSGETKGKDHQGGARLDDTAVTSLFVGPRVLFTWGTSLAMEGAVELPVVQHETALQIVADYRLRAAAVWRF